MISAQTLLTGWTGEVDPLPIEVVGRLPWPTEAAAVLKAMRGLAQLGDPDEIAESLEWKGIKGALGDPERHPLVRYLEKYRGQAELKLGQKILFVDCLPKLEGAKRLWPIRLGKRIRAFCEAFAAKKYPNLIGA